MKTLLYIGAALMTGAGIYGFVDYKQKEHSREFQSLYRKEKNIPEPAPARVAPTIVTAPVLTGKKETVFDAKEPVTGKKNVVKKKNENIRVEQFSRAPLEVEVEEIRLIEPDIKLKQ